MKHVIVTCKENRKIYTYYKKGIKIIMIVTKSNIGKISKVLKTGKTPPSKNEAYFKKDYNWYTPGDISNTKYICSSERHISELALNDRKAFLYPSNSILITCIGNIGRVGISKEKCASNHQITAIKPIEDVDVDYLYYWFIANQKLLQDKSNSAVVPILNNRSLKEVHFNYPPLKTQQHIAQILDDAAALRDKTQQLLTEYDLLAQSIFLEMFGDPGKNLKKWNKTKCGDFIHYLADIGSNGANKVVSEKLIMSDEEDYALMIRTTNFTNNDFTNKAKYVSKEVYNFFKKSQIFGGEIIMNKIGSAGDFWLMPNLDRPVSLGLNQFVIRLKDISALYFFYFLSTDYGRVNIKSRINGAATKSITKTAVRDLPMLVPPIELQAQFAKKIALIEQQKELATQELKESEDLFNSLLQKAFKGELVQ